MNTADIKMIERGIKIADSGMSKQDKIWAKYSRDKVDVGEKLACVIRTLQKALPLNRPMFSLSVGSSNEPQFRILEAVFRGGLYLLDIDKEALKIVDGRIRRQSVDHVRTILGDYRIFLDAKKTEGFLKNKLKEQKMDLIACHHSLYYCSEDQWSPLFVNLFRKILNPQGAIHAVMMACRDVDEYSTTWLYNHFAYKFFGMRNDQDLVCFREKLDKSKLFNGAEIIFKRTHIAYFADTFEEFMEGIWMIMLYPNVHKYNYKQKEEITEFIYRKFWKARRKLVQCQDHLAVYRGLKIKGIL